MCQYSGVCRPALWRAHEERCRSCSGCHCSRASAGGPGFAGECLLVHSRIPNSGLHSTLSEPLPHLGPRSWRLVGEAGGPRGTAFFSVIARAAPPGRVLALAAGWAGEQGSSRVLGMEARCRQVLITRCWGCVLRPTVWRCLWARQSPPSCGEAVQSSFQGVRFVGRRVVLGCVGESPEGGAAAWASPPGTASLLWLGALGRVLTWWVLRPLQGETWGQTPGRRFLEGTVTSGPADTAPRLPLGLCGHQGS